MTKFSKLIVLMFVSFILININDIMSQPVVRADARAFLNRTNFILAKARGAVEVGKVYTGDLVRAVHHQRFARILFGDGHYLRAIHQSNRARMLAFAAIRANKAEVAKEMELTKEEHELVKEQPEPKILDKEIRMPKNADDKSVLKEKEEEVKDQEK